MQQPIAFRPRTTSTNSKPPIPPKAPYRPHVRLIDRERGLFEVSSESCDIVLYDVDVVMGTCTCPAGQHHRHCKHLDRASYVALILSGKSVPPASQPIPFAAAPSSGYGSLMDAFE